MLDEEIRQIKEQMLSIDLKIDNMQKQLIENTKKSKDISKKIDKQGDIKKNEEKIVLLGGEKNQNKIVF